MPLLRTLVHALFAAFMFCGSPLAAQSLQEVLLPHQAEVEKASRRTVDAVVEDLLASGLPQVPQFLENWQNKNVWMRKADGAFFYVEDRGDDLALLDMTTLAPVGTAGKNEMTQLKPNSRNLLRTHSILRLSVPWMTSAAMLSNPGFPLPGS